MISFNRKVEVQSYIMMLIEEINEQFKKYRSGKQVIERYYSNHYSESLASSVRGAIEEDNKQINAEKFKDLITRKPSNWIF